MSLTQRLGKITVFGRALFTVIALLLGCATLFSCSNNKEAESEKGIIETFTDKTAKDVAGRILAPMEKARSVKDQQEDRFSDMEENLKEQ
ncbi:hypothetical protein ES703_91201 [subsurface metagenome]